MPFVQSQMTVVTYFLQAKLGSEYGKLGRRGNKRILYHVIWCMTMALHTQARKRHLVISSLV